MDSSDSDASVSSKKVVQKPKVQNRQNKRERDDHPALKRPIIFICNDFYGKNTAPLKEIVLAIKVEAAIKSQILERVSYILRQENIENIQIGLVQSIVDQANGDARSCINNIQFLAQANQLSKPHQIENLQKDRNQSIFKFMDEILFDKPNFYRSQLISFVRDHVDSFAGET